MMTRLGRLILVGAGLVAGATALVSLVAGTAGSAPADVAYQLVTAVAMVPCWAVGALIVVRAHGHRVGVLLVLASFFGSVVIVSLLLLGDPGAPTAVSTLAYLTVTAAYGLLFITLILAAMLLFPDGRLPGTRWFLPTALGCGVIIVASVARVVRPGPLYPGLPDNPIGITALPVGALDALGALAPIGIAGLAILGAASLVARYRQSGPDVRRQLKWLFVAVVPAVVLTPVAFFEADQATTSPADVVQAATLLIGVPMAIGIAILRYRLYEIDRLISRTIGWALVTGILVAVFAGLVVGLQAVLAPVTDENTLAVAASTLVAFALFQPLRRRVQHVVDRRFDRARYDGERTAAAFGERLRNEVDLAGLEADLTDTIAIALRPGSTAVWIRNVRFATPANAS